MLGTTCYSVASPQRIKTFSKGRCDPGNLEDTMRHLAPAVTGAQPAELASRCARSGKRMSEAPGIFAKR